MKYSVITFGCRVNQADSLGFEEQLLAAGAEAAPAETADLVVVNTCSVTASADQGARQTIRRIARANPSARIVVTGCYATRRKDDVAALPNVANVVCNDDKPKLLSLVWRDTDAGPDVTTAERFGLGDGECGASIQPGVAGRTAFTLRVQTGCDEQCSYCIIPETRGAPRSVPLDRLLIEIDRVRRAGFKEVALTGVHIGSYGRDLLGSGGRSFATPAVDLGRSPSGASVASEGRSGALELRDLLSAIRDRFEPLAGTPDSLLFRISSLEPMDCTPEVVALVASSRSFAPHFHLPLQHASDRMLCAMRRPYDRRYYSALVARIRRDLPAASIGSDIIVGFPGETDADFEELAAYLESSPLTHLHVFPYSDRPGTVASAMSDRAAGAVVKERGARVRAIGARLTRRFLNTQLGTTHRALTIEDGTLAVTGNYLKVRVPPGGVRNQWVNVRITQTEGGIGGVIAD
jgi:threonylcarbamoyladenosine tRNA methylthiotransferase MtaB